MQVEELRDLVVRILDDMKANDIKILDVRGKTSITDIMVIASGNFQPPCQSRLPKQSLSRPRTRAKCRLALRCQRRRMGADRSQRRGGASCSLRCGTSISSNGCGRWISCDRPGWRQRAIVNSSVDRFDRIFALHQLLSSHRNPVSRQRIEQVLECSRATAKRIVDNMRDYLNARSNMTAHATATTMPATASTAKCMNSPGLVQRLRAACAAQRAATAGSSAARSAGAPAGTLKAHIGGC